MKILIIEDEYGLADAISEILKIEFRHMSNENSITINGKEMELLQLLIVNKNQVLNRELITSKIWGYDSDAEYNNVEVYISFIRKK